MARFIDLVAVEGPERGMRYAIEENTYRVVGRAFDDGSSMTVRVTPDGDRALDYEQTAVVDELLRGRSRAGRSVARRGHDIALRDPSVSRTHALVFVEAGKATVADLVSTNGTKVNGAPVRDVALQPGDVIHLGKTRLRVEEG
jgi:pSer/pThr/pTyr-binding forkhead associated (FHA) protein